MSSTGTVLARVFTSDADIPLPGASVVFTQTMHDHSTLLAVMLTDRSGLTRPLTIDTPDPAQSLQPNVGAPPYSTVDIRVSYPGYSSVIAEGIQVFPNVETVQNVQLQPSSASEADRVFVIRQSIQPL